MRSPPFSINHCVLPVVCLICNFSLSSSNAFAERSSVLRRSRFAFFLCFTTKEGREGLITNGNNRNDNIWLSQRWSRFAGGISLDLC